MPVKEKTTSTRRTLTITDGFLQLWNAAAGEGFSAEDTSAHLAWAQQLALRGDDAEAAEYLRELAGRGMTPRVVTATLTAIAGTPVVGIHLGERESADSSIAGRKERGIAVDELNDLSTKIIRSFAEWHISKTRPTVVIFKAGRPILIYRDAAWTELRSGRKYISSARAIDPDTQETRTLTTSEANGTITFALTSAAMDAVDSPLVDYLNGKRRVRDSLRQPIDDLSKARSPFFNPESPL